jgi:hypothetical protein
LGISSTAGAAGATADVVMKFHANVVVEFDAPDADEAGTRRSPELLNGARSEPWVPAREAKVDRLDALRRWQLVQDRADDQLNVMLVVPEVVQERLERAVSELELRWGELESIRDLVGLDQTDVVFGHDGS